MIDEEDNDESGQMFIGVTSAGEVVLAVGEMHMHFSPLDAIQLAADIRSRANLALAKNLVTDMD